MDAPSGGGKLSLASVGFAGAGVASGGSAGGGAGYKELLVMALPKDDGLDGAKVAELIGAGLPDIGCSVRVRNTSLPSEFIRLPLVTRVANRGYFVLHR
jgi:hypothetical protein